MLASLRRWTGAEVPAQQPGIAVTVDAMDAAGVDFGLLSAWTSSHQPALISNEEVAGWVVEYPSRFAGLAAVDLNRPMKAVRELRRCVEKLGFEGLRVVPCLWEAAPTDRRYFPPYATCVELGVPFFTQVGHTGPLRPSETGRPIPYIDQVRSISLSSSSSAGTSEPSKVSMISGSTAKRKSCSCTGTRSGCSEFSALDSRCYLGRTRPPSPS